MKLLILTVVSTILFAILETTVVRCDSFELNVVTVDERPPTIRLIAIKDEKVVHVNGKKAVVLVDDIIRKVVRFKMLKSGGCQLEFEGRTLVSPEFVVTFSDSDRSKLDVIKHHPSGVFNF